MGRPVSGSRIRSAEAKRSRAQVSLWRVRACPGRAGRAISKTAAQRQARGPRAIFLDAILLDAIFIDPILMGPILKDAFFKDEIFKLPAYPLFSPSEEPVV